MTKAEYMKAGRMRFPVVCNGVSYARISEIIVKFVGEEERRAIHRNAPDELVFLRLVSINGNSSTVVPPDKVEIDPEIRQMYPGVFGDGED